MSSSGWEPRGAISGRAGRDGDQFESAPTPSDVPCSDPHWWDADRYAGHRSAVRKGAAGLFIGVTTAGGLLLTAAAAIYAFFAPAWWLVVPFGLLSTATIVSYHKAWYDAERSNDHARLAHLGPEAMHETRVANTRRAEARKRPVFWTMLFTDVVALGATLYTVARASTGLGWLALFLWVGFTSLAALSIMGENPGGAPEPGPRPRSR